MYNDNNNGHNYLNHTHKMSGRKQMEAFVIVGQAKIIQINCVSSILKTPESQKAFKIMVIHGTG